MKVYYTFFLRLVSLVDFNDQIIWLLLLYCFFKLNVTHSKLIQVLIEQLTFNRNKEIRLNYAKLHRTSFL